MENITYRNFEIEIHHDQDAQNPWESWDGCAPLMTKGARNFEKDYSDGEIQTYLKSLLVFGNGKMSLDDLIELTAFEFLPYFDEDYPTEDYTEQERWDAAVDEIEWTFDNMETICDAFGIPCLKSSVKGSCQGDYYDVFLCFTSEFAKVTGLSEEECIKNDVLEGGRELYENWAFGSVYGYNIQDGEVGSCWGFY